MLCWFKLVAGLFPSSAFLKFDSFLRGFGLYVRQFNASWKDDDYVKFGFDIKGGAHEATETKL